MTNRRPHLAVVYSRERGGGRRVRQFARPQGQGRVSLSGLFPPSRLRPAANGTVVVSSRDGACRQPVGVWSTSVSLRGAAATAAHVTYGIDCSVKVRKQAGKGVVADVNRGENKNEREREREMRMKLQGIVRPSN